MLWDTEAHCGTARDARCAVHEDFAALFQALLDEGDACWEVPDEHCRLHVEDWDGQMGSGALWRLIRRLSYHRQYMCVLVAMQQRSEASKPQPCVQQNVHHNKYLYQCFSGRYAEGPYSGQ